MCSDEVIKTLNLKYVDLFRNSFETSSTGDGFHEMLIALSLSYNAYNDSREGMIRSEKQIELQLQDPQPFLRYIMSEEIKNGWAEVSDKKQAFLSNREDALILAHDALLWEGWGNPLILNGYNYNGETDTDCVIGYLKTIKMFQNINKHQQKNSQ